jgi:hypothetical protein
MNPTNIDFTDHERISDILMYLSDKITLNFVTRLAKKSMTGDRMFFSYETKYTSDKYNYNSMPSGGVRSIKRNMDFYFTIENKEVFANSMILRPKDAEMLLMIIEQQIYPWYFGTPKQMAFKFVKDNNQQKLVLGEYSPVQYAQNTNKYIIFEPTVYSYESGEYTYGIKMNLSGHDIVDLELDNFMGFVRLLKTDMYAVSCAQINYAKIPPYGINTFEMGKGLGASRRPANADDWNPNIQPQKGLGSGNSFLNNTKSKKDK